MPGRIRTHSAVSRMQSLHFDKVHAEVHQSRTADWRCWQGRLEHRRQYSQRLAVIPRAWPRPPSAGFSRRRWPCFAEEALKIARSFGARCPQRLAQLHPGQKAKAVTNNFGNVGMAGLRALVQPEDLKEVRTMPPEQYERIRDRLVKEGKSLQAAKTEAAKIWNSRHPRNTNPWNKEKQGKPSTSGRVGKYEVHGEDEGRGYVVTAPDGSVASTHTSLQDARIAADEANKSPAQRKAAPAAQGRPSYSDEDLKAYSELDAKLKSPPPPVPT